MVDKNNRQRARRYGVPYEAGIRAVEIYERDGWVCGICRLPVDEGLKYPDMLSASLDHVVPLARGGGHVRGNLQLAHFICNSRKSAEVQGAMGMDAENRRTAIGAALRGERVAVFCRTWEDAKDELRLVADEWPAGVACTALFAAGRLRISPDGVRGLGVIRFYSLGSGGYRGWSCDRVFLPASASDEIRAAVVPMVAASRVGEVVRV